MASTTHFLVPDGTTFDPNFGIDLGHDRDSDLLEQWNSARIEADNRLQKYGFAPIDLADLKKTVAEVASEVGDDEEFVTNSRAYAGLVPVFHRKYGMIVSEKDTSMNSRFGNLAEDLVILPDGYYQTYHNARNTSGFTQMSYLDVPKLRLAIDIRPGRMDHSSTNDGKAALVGSRNSWIPRDSPIKGIYEIFSLFQDVNLGLRRDKRFAYLPQALGGYGKPIPFGTPENFEAFNSSFRQGQWAELNREIIRRCIVYLHNESLGYSQERDPLLGHIVRFESSFHDWIKNQSIYAPISWVDIPENLGVHRAGKTGSDKRLNAALSRLTAEGRLVTSKQLEVAIEHNELCRALLSAQKFNDFKSQRDRKIAEWRSLSLYTLKTYGLIRELRLEGYGTRRLRNIEVLRFEQLVKDKRNLLKSTLKEETFYFPEAMEEVYNGGPMKVHFRFYPTHGINRSLAENPPQKDVVDTEEIGALDQLYDWLKGGQNGPMPRTMVNDDDPLIAEAPGDSVVCLVTEDRRLCREMNRRVGCPVVRVPVEWYYRSLYYGDNDQPWVGKVRETFPTFNVVSMEDTGSIQSAEELMFKDGTMLAGHIKQPFNMAKRLDEKDPIIAPPELEDYSDQPPAGRPQVFDLRNLLKQRSRHPRRYGGNRPRLRG